MTTPGWIADDLDLPEGGFQAGFSLPAPIDQPPEKRETLLEMESAAKSSVRIDLDENFVLYFVRQAPGGEPAEVAVDISPLRGAQRVYIVGAWTPTQMAVSVADRDSDREVSETRA